MKKPGLTLIEVIISVALLAILSIPIFITVNTNVKLSQKTELSQQATVVGQRVLEYLGSINVINDNTLSDLNDLIDLENTSLNDSEPNMFNMVGKTKQGFNVNIQLKKLIDNELGSDNSLSSNDLMKNPQFIITEDNNTLMINGNKVSNPYKLKVYSSNNSLTVAQFCANEASCIESDYNEQLAIIINGEIKDNYQILVENDLSETIKIYVQFQQNQSQNIQFKRKNREKEEEKVEKGEIEINYLTKAPNVQIGENELTVEKIDDLYEIDVLITSDKIDGTLFKGNTVSSLKIYEKE